MRVELKLSTGQGQAQVTKGHGNIKCNIPHATHVFWPTFAIEFDSDTF